jgi:hypothetical protein
MNPDFFEGTRCETAVRQALDGDLDRRDRDRAREQGA